MLTAFAESDDEAPRYAAPLRMASKHTGRRRRPTPEITSSVLDFHSWSLPCCNAQRYFAMQYGVLRMRESGEVLARLRAFRSKFEGLLASARKKAVRDRVAPGRRPTRLRELTGFGANPGNLRMFAYVPEHMPPKAPLVSGCPMGAPATLNKHSRPCSRSRDMPRRRLAIACGQHPDIAGHGRKSRYGMAPAIRS